MSNMFKPNSRFAILSEDVNDNKKSEKKKDLKNEKKKDDFKEVKEAPKINSFKDDRPKYDDRSRNTNNLFSRKLSDKVEQQRKEDEIKRQNDELEKALSIDNFPELSKNNDVITNTNTNTIEVPNFLEKIKQEKKIVEDVKKNEEIPYGWVLIKHNKETNKSYTEYDKKYEEDEKIKNEQEERILPFMILDSLVGLYLKRKNKYINEWGNDEYEKMFISPNYDYEYFDKLDAKYEEEMKKLREMEDAQEETNNDFITNSEQFNNYWNH
jgi:hypothetical protein